MCSTMGTSARTTLRAMGRVDLEDLNEEECEKILEVIQRDYDVRSREKERIIREKEELEDEQFKAEILARKGDFNTVCCIRCCNKFGVILNRKRTCATCKFNMCKTCTVPDKKTNEDLCKVCFQQREISAKACDFFYSGMKQKFTKSGSAKFVKTLRKRRESDIGIANYDTMSVCESEEGGGGGLKRRPSLLNLLEQTKQLCEETSSSRFDTASIGMGRRCTWAGGALPAPDFQAPIKQFEMSLNKIIDDIHRLIDDYDMMNDTEVLDPEHFLFRKPRREIYEELLKLSQHISDSMVSDSDEDDDIMQRTNSQSAIRVRRYIVQKVEHVTKSNLKHLLPDENEDVDNWDTDSGKQFLEDQLCFVILKKILENYTGRCSSSMGHHHNQPMPRPLTKIVITEEHGHSFDHAESYCSTLMPRSLSPQSERRSRSSESDCIQSDMTLPSFSSGSNRDVNLKIATLMKGNSPMPSLENNKSPIGRLEMDLDDLSSLQKFVYYSDEEPEPAKDPFEDDPDFFQDQQSPKNFLLKEQGSDELKAWTPAEDKHHYIKPPNVAMPHHTDRISPMVGDIIVEDLSDLSDPPSESESDVAATEEDGARAEPATKNSDSEDEEKKVVVAVGVLDLPSRRKGSKTMIEDLPEPKRPTVREEPKAERPVKKPVEKVAKPVDVEKTSYDIEPVARPQTLPIDRRRGSEQQATVETSSNDSYNETQEAQEDSNTESTTEESDPRILSMSKQTSVKKGDALTLTCELHGTAPLDAFWYFEKDFGSSLENDEKYEITRKGNTYSLTVYYCDTKDAGEYLLIGVNEIGQCSRRFRIRVSENPIPFKQPEFLKQISDIELFEGKSHKFMVRVIGQPPPRVIWYKDTELLTPSEEYQIEKIGNRNFSLSLYSLTLEDDAEYSAVAINAAGRTSCSAQLFVESKR